ncbi:MAG: proline--tRNA ligase [Bacilli bacterium]|nr:proline--tRNA ligase [Bacilli bacterium]
MKNDKITLRSEDFAKWYTDVVKAAHLADYSSVKGCVIFEANGYALWEKIQQELDKMFKKTGHQNVYMPVFIPESLLRKEGELIEGFAPECAWITEGGNNKLEERLAFRPTSETLFSDYYSKTVKTYRDLPKLYNQWCSVVRWEKETRPFLRSREFLWQEGHTVHASEAEAKAETDRMLDVYKTFFEEYLAVPAVTGRKTEKEKFAGAEYTLTIETLTQNGICLQSGTSHYFGQKFSKAYDIKFINKNNEYDYCYQTSWGVSNRMIGALIMAHSDDRGLVLPPKIAPKQVVIIPITNDEKLISVCEHINESLLGKDISSYVDYTDKSAGFKFAEAEVNGIPIRIEVGLRDLNNNEVTIVRRDNLEKQVVKLNDVINVVTQQMELMQKDMFERALKNMKEKTYDASNMEEVKEIMENHPGFVNAYWCGDEACELKMKEIRGTKSRCIIESKGFEEEKCVVCNKKAKHKVVWGIQY